MVNSSALTVESKFKLPTFLTKWLPYFQKAAIFILPMQWMTGNFLALLISGFFSRTKAGLGEDHPESASFGANILYPEQLSLINGKIEYEDEQLCHPGFGKAA